MDRLRKAVESGASYAFDVLERLVAQPSTVGQEACAQEVLAQELAVAGFELTSLEIPASIGADPAAGVPSRSYAGRYDLVGQRGTVEAGLPSLLINGHIDVVPAADAAGWENPPFVANVKEGWMTGRGAGDMKGGFAAGLLALQALDKVEPGWLNGRLTWVSAIEEECTGNGTLAAGRAGYLAEAALLLEPTDLGILLGGISIIWVGIEIEGLAGHAEAAQRSVNPVLGAMRVIEGLRQLETTMNDQHAGGDDPDAAFVNIAHPYNVNVGTFHAGDWASSVPALARLEVRVGHPASWSSEDAFAHVQAAVEDATKDDDWLCSHPPRLILTGYRAQRHVQDLGAHIVTRLGAAHRAAHGSEPVFGTIASTNDARFYINQFGLPAVAYGPRTRNMHGTNEAVELASILDCADTVARFLLDWFAPRQAL